MSFPKPPKREKKPPKRLKRGGPIARRSRPRKERKTPRAKLKKIADDLCRRIVRARGACESCGSTTDLQWAHGYSRKYLRTRWSTWFTFCLCRSCHCKFTYHWEQWVDWMIAKLGQQLFDKMRTDALDKTPISNDEIQETIEKLQAALTTQGASHELKGATS